MPLYFFILLHHTMCYWISVSEPNISLLLRLVLVTQLLSNSKQAATNQPQDDCLPVHVS